PCQRGKAPLPRRTPQLRGFSVGLGRPRQRRGVRGESAALPGKKRGCTPQSTKPAPRGGGAPAVLCRLEERDALWGTQNDNMGGNKFLKRALRPPGPKSRAAPTLPRGPEPP